MEERKKYIKYSDTTNSRKKAKEEFQDNIK
jgi:hypothetical protein